MTGCLEDIDIAVLCGGRGTRAQSYLGDIPKVLAPIAGIPLIERHLDYLRSFGAKRIILIAGHGSEQVGDWVKDRGGASADLALFIDEEVSGPGNALRSARHLFGHAVMVTNGDTLLAGDLENIVPHMKARQPSVLTVGGKSSGVFITVASLIEANIMLAVPMEALFDFSFIDIGTPEGYRAAQERYVQ